MGKRSNTRLKLALPVRVIGVEPNNRAIRQMACTLDVSARGARLNGLHQRLEPGGIVAVERGKCRVLFRVMWMGSREEGRHGQAGIQALDPDTNPWEGVEFAEEPDEEFVPVASFRSSMVSGQVGSRSYACEGAVMVSALPSSSPLDARLRDLSANGCYVHTDRPLKMHTKVAACLFLRQGTVAVRGTVTSRDDFQGMWVEFSAVKAGDVQVLSATLESLQGSAMVM